MSKKFKREDRYMVIKYKDAQHLSLTDKAHLSRIGKRLERIRAGNGKSPMSCVVVESDWPEYEIVFKMIECRVSEETRYKGFREGDLDVVSSARGEHV